MAKKVDPSDNSLESLIDVFEAIKRAMIRRGFIPQRTKKTADEKRPAKKASSEEKNKDQKGSEKLVDMAEKSHDILFKANTVFPFTLFPDTVTLDREKISFASRIFFRVAKVTSIPVRDLLSVEADVGPFFGSVHTASRYFITNPKEVNYLWRKDAVQLQRLLQGYIIVHEQKIDCADLNKHQLKTLLEELGKGDTG